MVEKSSWSMDSEEKWQRNQDSRRYLKNIARLAVMFSPSEIMVDYTAHDVLKLKRRSATNDH